MNHIFIKTHVQYVVRKRENRMISKALKFYKYRIARYSISFIMKGVKVLIILKNFNLGLRFFLELIALVSLGYWGFKINATIILKICFGIGLPLITAIIWGTFGSPRASRQISKPFQWVLLFTIYLLSAFALLSIGKKYIGIIYLVTAAVNSFLMYIWEQ